MDSDPGPRQTRRMGTRVPAIIAVIITRAFGLGFAVFDEVPRWYPVGGGVLVAAAWVAVGMISNRSPRRDP